MKTLASCLLIAGLSPLGILAGESQTATGPAAINVGDEFFLLEGGPGRGVQGTPHVAYGKGLYLVVWREGWHGKGGKARIYAARVSPQGKVLDPKGIEVAPAEAGVQERPRVAYGGGVFLVVWQDLRNGKDYDVLAARIDPHGRVLDASPIGVAVGPRTQVLPDVASDGDGFLVVWQGLQGEETAYRGFAATVSREGTVGPAIETGATPQPKIAWNGRSYLAAYGSQTVFSVMLDRKGRPLNATKYGNQTIRSTKAAAFSVSAVPGRGWLVVGHRSPPDPWGWGGPGAMRAALVGADGKLQNQDAVKEPSGVWSRLPGWLDLGKDKSAGATWPWGESTSAWDGAHSLVVWQRHRLRGEKMTNFTNCDLVAARVDGFRSLDPAGIPIAASQAEEKWPALASDGAGNLLCVYEKHQDGGTRIAARRIAVTNEEGGAPRDAP
jgi:hypothetical protein